MEEMTTLYETNWSLFGIDGELLPGPPSPLSEQWYQQDDLKKTVGGPSDGALDQLVSVQQALAPEDLDSNWLDCKTSLFELLQAPDKEDQVATSEPRVSLELAPVTDIQPSVSGEEAIEELLESLEREVPEGIVDLNNGQAVSQSLLELLTSDDTHDSAAVGNLSAHDIDEILSSGPSSPVGSVDDSFDSDPNWSPAGSQCSSRRNSCSVSKQRPAPYEKQGRSMYSNPDKKLRKKEQNRTAATRYRHKKRKETDTVMDEYMRLESRNKELKESVNNISQEIAYLKNLMAEVYKARKELKR